MPDVWWTGYARYLHIQLAFYSTSSRSQLPFSIIFKKKRNNYFLCHQFELISKYLSKTQFHIWIAEAVHRLKILSKFINDTSKGYFASLILLKVGILLNNCITDVQGGSYDNGKTRNSSNSSQVDCPRSGG